MPTDLGFRIQLVITVLVAVAVLWVGIQTGDWTGLLLVIPLIVLLPIVAKLPAERPRRRAKGDTTSPTQNDEGPRRY
jgi:hypothetical protein